ncbi:MAG: CRISPR-associated ring nuclease Csm6 [Kiritimatiellia bacterium]
MKTSRKKTVLFSVTGMTPSVLTETVWALAHEKPAVIPDRVIVVTTTTGRDQLVKALFGADKIWEALRHSLNAGSRLQFGTTPHDIKVFTTQDPKTGLSRELDDLRTAADNLLAADFILEQLRALTENPDTHIVASLAGGRKTMGALLVSCMALIGRETDRLTHVLVNEPFDTRLEPGFFFPAQPARKLKKNDGKTVNTASAAIELADVPFVPLRNRFEDIAAFPGHFSALVGKCSRALKADANRKCLIRLAANFRSVAVDGQEVPLRVRAGLVLAFLLHINKINKIPRGQPEAIAPLKAFLADLPGPITQSWKDPNENDIKRELSFLRKALENKRIAWKPGLYGNSLTLPPFKTP